MEAPSLDCPMNIIVESDPGVCSANVSFSDMVNATDNCDPDPTITCYPMSGSSFNISVDTVTCLAEDESGNVGSCNFSVIVEGIITSLLLTAVLAIKKKHRDPFMGVWYIVRNIDK